LVENEVIYLSRPFSYNDENFTVIGNILFIHVNIGGNEYQIGQALFNIPQAIFIRMINYNQQATISNENAGASSIIAISCDKNGNVITNVNITPPASVRFIFSWFPLKDI